MPKKAIPPHVLKGLAAARAGDAEKLLELLKAAKGNKYDVLLDTVADDKRSIAAMTRHLIKNFEWVAHSDLTKLFVYDPVYVFKNVMSSNLRIEHAANVFKVATYNWEGDDVADFNEQMKPWLRANPRANRRFKVAQKLHDL